MDDNLGDESGADGLVAVRDKFAHKDIIYYSADSKSLGQNVAERGVQGVFWTHRDYLVDTVYEVFENLVKKVVDLDHSRGIVLGATSSVDELVERFLKLWLSRSPAAQKTVLDTYTQELTRQKKEKFDERMASIGPDSKTVEILDIDLFLESLDKMKLCLKVLKLQGSDEVSKTILTRYIAFMPNRNILAHVSATSGPGFSRVLRRKDGSEFTLDQMTKLRKDLLDYLDFFENLDAYLPALGEQ
jgi:hypothetical protein